jgi:primosomal protein N' (replication factor Y)
MNDYWASERALQMLIQVAGRAGRGTQPGQVFLQTYTPDHPVVEAVTGHAYEGFIAAEWAQRQMLQYPPAGQMVLLRLSSTDPDAVQQTAEILAQQVTSAVSRVVLINCWGQRQRQFRELPVDTVGIWLLKARCMSLCPTFKT